MAKAKKKEALSLEEKLEQALVPVDEQPYEVPENWCWTRIENISETVSKGTTPKGGKDAYIEEGVKFLRVENFLDDGMISHEGIAHIANDVHECFLKRSILQENDVLVSIAGTLGKTAIIQKEDLPINTNQAVAFIRINPKMKVLPTYLRYSLANPAIQNHLLGKTKVTSIPNLTLEIISSCPVPVPPLAEQQRIVEQIESLFAKLNEAKEKATEVLSGFRVRKNGIYHKAFSGDLTEVWRKDNYVSLETWKRLKLEEVVNNLDSIRIPLSQTERENIEKLYDYYGASGVIDKVDNYLFDGKYLLIGEDGANLVTRSKPIAFIAEGKFWVNNHAHIFEMKENMNMEYMCHYINSIDLIPFVTGSAQPKLSQKMMNKIPVVVPDIKEQQQIVEIINLLFEKETQAEIEIEQFVEKIELMKKSILAKAFRGELGTNNLDEESAVELLKQILTEDL